ncbi:MAG: hypothetical protein OEV42_19405 [Deltaproteobacteria bacterium]|nr:hypothetical protein [Deltaproteobacteria bacterium]
MKVDELKEAFINMVKPEDLNEDLRLVAEQCGLDVAIRLADKMPSMGIYVRPIKGMGEIKERFVSKYFTGSNRKEIALVLGVSDRWVYEIYKKARQEKKNQPGLFDSLSPKTEKE